MTSNATKHGHRSLTFTSPTYRSWSAMRQRVTNPKHNSHPYYIARNIDMDPRWDDFEVFLADVGECPPDPADWTGKRRYYSLDRIDNDRGYWPDNVRWATPKEQMANRRNTVAA